MDNCRKTKLGVPKRYSDLFCSASLGMCVATHTSARNELLARFCRFYRGLLTSPSREVSILANLLGRDIRSATGSNLM